jgi:hypothetical protein
MTKLIKICVVIFLLFVTAPWLVSTGLHAVSEGLATTLYSAGGALKTAVMLIGMSLLVWLVPIIGRPLAVVIGAFGILIGGVAGIVLMFSSGGGGGGNAAPTATQTVAPAAGSAGTGEVFRGSAFPGSVK